MALEAGRAFIDLVPRLAKDFGEQVDKALRPTLANVGDKLDKVGRNLTTKLTLPLAAGAGVAVFRSNELAGSLREVVTLTGETGAEADATFTEFQGLVSQLSKELGVAQTTLTGGLYQALSAGVPRDNALEFMRVASQAAIAGVTDTETAVDGLSTIINAFGLSASDAGRVADSMFTTVKLGKTNFEELSSSLFNVAPLAAAAGVEFTDVNAALGALTAQGVPTAQATTQIRAALQGLLKPSEDLDKIFRKAGFKDAADALEQDFGGALEVVRKATGGDIGELTKLLGSVEAVGAVLGLTGDQAAGFARNLDAQATSAGATAAAFGEIDKSRDLERLKVTLDNLAITIGNVLLPIVQDIAAAVLPWIARFAELDGRTQKIIAGAIAALAALGPLLRIIGNLAKAISGLIRVGKFVGRNLVTLGKNFAKLGRAALRAAANIAKAGARMIVSAAKATAKVVAQIAVQIARWVALGAQALIHAAKVAAAWLISLGPIAIVGAAVIALVGLIIANWDKVSRFLSDTWDAIGRAASAAWDFVKRVIGQAADFVVDLFLNFTLPGLLIKHWDTIKDSVAAVKDFIVDRFTEVIDFLTSIPGRVAEFAGSLFNAVADNARTVVDNVVGFFRDLPSRIGDLIGAIAGKAAEIGKSILDGIVAGVGQAGGAALDFAKAFGRAVRNFLDDKVLGAFRSALLTMARGLAGVNIPGIGRGFDAASRVIEGLVENMHLPEFHRGEAAGVIPGRPGEEVLVKAKAGERVSTPGQDRRRGPGMLAESITFVGMQRPRDVVDELTWLHATGGRA